MSYTPHLTDGQPIRHDPPPAHHYCVCGITFEAPSEEQAVRLHAEHQAEMIDPAAHEGSPF